jgi:hypothetical protein
MDSWGTIVTGWVVVLVGIALYAGWLLLRARVLARELGLGDDRPRGDADAAMPVAGEDGS